MSKKSLFKSYPQNQLELFPRSYDSMISPSHPVRLVNMVVDKLNLDPILSRYRGGGAPSYHPRMMLKVLVYGYMRNIYSSRKLEEALKENIHFIWLSGGNQPDHNSINRFRTDRLGEVLKEVFSQVVMMLHEAGHLSIKELYTDGTKLEAQANRYTFIWGRAIQKNKSRIASQLKEMWQYAESVAKEELLDTQVVDFDSLDPDQVAQTIEKIDEVLKKKTRLGTNKQLTDKQLAKQRQKLNYARKNWPSNLRKYQRQEAIMGDRNSYSKTDTDATFMRMKEDHMKNGQLKPAYNLQLSTNSQYIVHYSLHPNPTDTLTLIPHLEGLKASLNQLPEKLTADAGYGSEENYGYLEENRIEAYLKYTSYHQEQTGRKQKKRPFDQQYLHYDPSKDQYICPMGQKMRRIGTKKKYTASGYEQSYQVYQAENCQGCPIRTRCHKSKYNRKIEVNPTFQRLKNKALDKLLSEEGKERMKNRATEVESVFANLKHNHHFRRFALRGRKKVAIETGLHALAHNFRKMAKDRDKEQAPQPRNVKQAA